MFTSMDTENTKHPPLLISIISLKVNVLMVRKHSFASLFFHYIVYARFKVFSSRRYLRTLSRIAKIEAGDLQPCASPTVAAATLPSQDGPPVAARVLSARSSFLGCSFAALVGGRFVHLSLIILLI